MCSHYSSYQHWDSPPSNLQLLAHEVHVWRARLEPSESVIKYLKRFLSKDEFTKARSFRFENDRKRWIVAHGILRLLLSRYVNTDPLQLRLDSNAYGKPFLVFPILAVSLFMPFHTPGTLALMSNIKVQILITTL